MTAEQLPLMIDHAPAYDDAGFLTDPSNAAARLWLDRTGFWPERRLALWGDAARGKTHLLRMWARRHCAAVLHGPDLIGLPDLDGVIGAAVDDAAAADETALLHLLNTARDRNLPVLLASRLPPARWGAGLDDLASRLRAITAVEVGAPGDGLLRGLLAQWLAERRLFIETEALHDRLLTWLPRRPEAVREAVMRLDRDALLSRRRTVSAPMLRAALLAAADEEGAGRDRLA